VDPYKLFDNGLPDLITDATGTIVKGHEGRHRLSALRKAGVDIPLPVRVSKNFRTGLDADEVRALSNQTLRGQDFGHPGRGSPLDLDVVEPLSWGNRGKILDMQQEVDIPLKSVSVMLKPEGALATEANLKAWGRSRGLPYGNVTEVLKALRGE
jgi:hypothetical protein